MYSKQGDLRVLLRLITPRGHQPVVPVCSGATTAKTVEKTDRAGARPGCIGEEANVLGARTGKYMYI